ncbi:hypothetical protein GGF32_000163 [Allomyces javanicus]|nr:hypothetical protein GGF32_000163 [Allomyces javanicus]
MALLLLRYATVDERDWVYLAMQRPVLALLDELVRATLNNQDSPDRDGVSSLSLLVLDVLLHLRSLWYLWMRGVPADVLDIACDYTTQHLLDATLLADQMLALLLTETPSIRRGSVPWTSAVAGSPFSSSPRLVISVSMMLTDTIERMTYPDRAQGIVMIPALLASPHLDLSAH